MNHVDLLGKIKGNTYGKSRYTLLLIIFVLRCTLFCYLLTLAAGLVEIFMAEWELHPGAPNLRSNCSN